MEKIEDHYKTYKTLSSTEAQLLNKIENIPLFSTTIVQRCTGWSRTKIHNALFSLKKKRIISAIKKDSFVITEKIPEHLFSIAVHVTAPAYLSFWTAASYYGLTEQCIQSLQLVSTKQYKERTFYGHCVEVITMTPKRFFGYTLRDNFAIAEKERLIIDILYKPEMAGGIKECQKIIKNVWPEIDQNMLLLFLNRFENKSLYARLGYLLEASNISSKIKKSLQQKIPQTYVLLNSQKTVTNQYNKKWRVIINDQ